MKITFPTKRGPVEVDQQAIDALKKVWPTKDVDVELNKALIWLLRFPKREPVYFWTFVRNWMRKSKDVIKPAPKLAMWWKSDAETLEVGKAVNVLPRAGEEMPQYRKRIADALAAKRAAQH